MFCTPIFARGNGLAFTEINVVAGRTGKGHEKHCKNATATFSNISCVVHVAHSQINRLLP